MHSLDGPKAMPVHELYNYTFQFPFEKNFDKIYWTLWFRNYWFYSIALSIFYVITIYSGRKFMRDRPAFDLKKPLAYWNFATALFSLLGALRMTPEFFYVVWNYGFHYSICTSGYTQLKVAGFWATMFTLSKSVELIDTAFIVLRKRPLIFLHWYHHVTVLLLTWYGFKDHPSPARWFIWMNYNVHALMYAYYGVRAIGWRTPKWISVTVTTLQITQMLIGCYIAFDVYQTKMAGEFCQQTERHLRFTIIVYFSYLILFVHFFYDAYLKSGKRKSPSSYMENGLKNGIANGDNHKIKDN